MRKLIFKTVLPILLIFLSAVSYAKFSAKPSLFTSQKYLLDTYITLKAESIAGVDMESAANSAFKKMENIESAADIHSKKPNEIKKINQLKTINNPSKTLLDLVKLSSELNKLTEGYFDPAILPVVRLWGIGTKNYIPEKNEIDEKLKYTGMKSVSIKDNEVNLGKSSLDFGAILKGYAVDEAGNILNNSGIDNFLISTVSSIKASGANPSTGHWSVGIENPRKGKGSAVIAVLKLKGPKSVSTSGDYQLFFIKKGKRYSHIINPKTGYPADECISVTVVTGKSAAYADAASTAVFAMGYREGIDFVERNRELEALIVDNKGAVHLSSGMRRYLKSWRKSIYE